MLCLETVHTCVTRFVRDGWAVLHDGDEIKLLRVSIPDPGEMGCNLSRKECEPDCRVFQGADLKFLEID